VGDERHAQALADLKPVLAASLAALDAQLIDPEQRRQLTELSSLTFERLTQVRWRTTTNSGILRLGTSRTSMRKSSTSP